MGSINFFNSIEHMEPKCPKCEAVIKYGLTTSFDETSQKHKCNQCGEELE